MHSIEEWEAAAGLKRRGRERVGPCPRCGGTDRFHVKEGRDGQPVVGCRGCIDGRPKEERDQRFKEVLGIVFPRVKERRFEPRPWPGPRLQRAPAARRAAPTESQRIAYAQRVWAASEPIPQDDKHPGRRWLARRNLWWPGLDLPAGVRYCPSLPIGWAGHARARPPRWAAVVAAMAQPEDWAKAWPETPTPTAAHCIFIWPNGEKAPPNKRTLGAASAVMLGPPAPRNDELLICEGVADGLALASRRWETVLCIATVPWESGPIFEYAATWSAVTIFADADYQGRRGARKVSSLLAAGGAKAAAVILTGGKDAADYAATGDPLPDVRRRWQDVVDLASEWDGLPRWETLRRPPVHR